METAVSTIWSTQQLAEFLTAVTRFGGRDQALRGAVEWAAEALEAELGAVLSDGGIAATVGFPPDRVPATELALLAAHPQPGAVLEAPGLGRCPVIVAPLEDEALTTIVLARSGAEFAADEAALLRAMARSLSLWLGTIGNLEEERVLRRNLEVQAEENLRLAAALGDRQRLLERLLQIQVLISRRASLDKVLDSIVAGAAELLGDHVVWLRLVDPNLPTMTSLVASVGLDAEDLRLSRVAVADGIGGQAIREDRVVVSEDYAHDPAAAGGVHSGVRAAMAAPIHEDGRVVGSISVGSSREGRTYPHGERTALMFFANHVGMALRDARLVDEMRRLAYHDALTELPNRAKFVADVERALAQARRRGERLAVLFLDVDRFKLVNDSFGHAAGDQLLAVVAERVRGALRQRDIAARLGGDELAILATRVNAQSDAVALGQRILDVFRGSVSVSDREITVSASVGIAISRPGATAGSLLRDADLAMYRAKGEGGGRLAVYEATMHADIARRVDLETNLRRAVENGDFVVHYQPIVELGGGRVDGVEALLRWAPHGGPLIGPEQFITVAEELGLISAIGRWVLQAAMRDVRDWQRLREPDDELHLSINLSAHHLQETDLVVDVLQALVDTGFAAGNLVLEITETALMVEARESKRKLTDLKRLGVRLALDDFGTGYSSLGYLRQFPVDQLKVDRSFIAGMGQTPDNSSLARAIIDFGQALGLELVAEGIENRRQLSALMALGCPLGQGFLLGRPMPAAEFERWLLASERRLLRLPRRRSA